MKYEDLFNNIDLYDIDIHIIMKLFLSKKIISDTITSFEDDFYNNEFIKFLIDYYEKKKYKVEINSTFDKNDLNTTFSEHYFIYIIIKDEVKKQYLMIEVKVNGSIIVEKEKEKENILSFKTINSLKEKIALIKNTGLVYIYSLNLDYKRLMKYEIFTDTKKEKIESFDSLSNNELYKDIVEELKLRKNLTNDFLDLLKLKHDFNEDSLTMEYLSKFKEPNFFNNINDNLLKYIEKNRKINNILKN